MTRARARQLPGAGVQRWSGAGIGRARPRDRIDGGAERPGVFLIGVPVSSLTGADKEGIIAQRKGEVVAIEVAQRQAGC